VWRTSVCNAFRLCSSGMNSIALSWKVSTGGSVGKVGGRWGLDGRATIVYDVDQSR